MNLEERRSPGTRVGSEGFYWSLRGSPGTSGDQRGLEKQEGRPRLERGLMQTLGCRKPGLITDRISSRAEDRVRGWPFREQAGVKENDWVWRLKR